MKIYVDVSVMTSEESAGGRVSGILDLVAVPSIGATLVLSNPRNKVPYVSVAGFTGHIRVTDVRFEPCYDDAVSVALSLEDVVVPTMSEARVLMQFLSEGFGLSAEAFE
jgi:hypothetical protein